MRRAMAAWCSASSHARAFVIEVMGRHSGYLASIAAIATEAGTATAPTAPYTAIVRNQREKLRGALMVRRHAAGTTMGRPDVG